MYVEGALDLRTLQPVGIRGYLPLTLFAFHAYGPCVCTSCELTRVWPQSMRSNHTKGSVFHGMFLSVLIDS